MMIHKTAIVSPKAELHETVRVDPFAIIEDDVKIGEGSHIKSHAYIADGARIGKKVRIFHGAVISTIPQDLKFEGEQTLAEIGDDTTIREYVTVNRGTSESGATRVGKNCLMMAYSHAAHDCQLGDNVIMANSANLGGHVHIDDNAIIGGIVPVHQFVHIGCHAMIGGGFRVPQDVVPYALIGGYPPRVVGLNLIGLRRRGFSKEAIAALRQTYKLLFSSNLNTTQALNRIKDEIEMIPEVEKVVTFVEQSGRGIIK
jgi:UDP-N-acetylglucosamine acyltransferase